MNNEPVVWKAYEEVHFNDQYILRWVREGDEYVNKITKEMMEDLKSVVRQQQALINQREDEIKAFCNLVAEQDKKIIDLAFKLAYAERGNEVVKEAKYGITTKWDGITTYHETTEPIGKAQKNG